MDENREIFNHTITTKKGEPLGSPFLGLSKKIKQKNTIKKRNKMKLEQYNNILYLL